MLVRLRLFESHRVGRVGAFRINLYFELNNAVLLALQVLLQLSVALFQRPHIDFLLHELVVERLVVDFEFPNLIVVRRLCQIRVLLRQFQLMLQQRNLALFLAQRCLHRTLLFANLVGILLLFLHLLPHLLDLFLMPLNILGQHLNLVTQQLQLASIVAALARHALLEQCYLLAFRLEIHRILIVLLLASTQLALQLFNLSILRQNILVELRNLFLQTLLLT
mmetsp:Transcript_22861/g.36723  ORF Transcript_22861/g.36723 Transcript_22861/m.36723 type:complete len:222 (-) Transcript_22861:1954-2619(-)